MARPRVGVRARSAGAQAPAVPARAPLARPGRGVVAAGEDGVPRRIVWSDDTGRVVHVRQVPFLRKIPGMAGPLAEGIAAVLTSASAADSVKSTVDKIGRGLVRYLAEAIPGRGPDDLRTSDVEGMASWLRKAGFAEKTCLNLFGAATRVLAATPGVGCRMPVNPFENARTATPLTRTELQAVLSAATREVVGIMAWTRASWDEEDALWSDPAEGPRLAAFRDLRRSLGEGLPTRQAAEATGDADLLAAFDLVAADLKRLWGPTLDNLCAFFVLLLWFFRLNVGMVRTLLWSEFDRVADEMIVSKVKKRGGVRQLPGYPVGEEPVNPSALRDFLWRWGEPLRSSAGPDRNRVLLVWDRHARGPKARGLAPNGPGTMARPFGARAGVPDLKLKDLRPTAVDWVAVLDRGDRERPRAAGGHGADVSRRHYRSDGAALEDRKRFALAQMLRQSDMRRATAASALGRAGSGGALAATPGWICSDPGHRAFSDAPEGQPCDAVGMCPVCIRGDTDLGCVRSYASVLALRDAVDHELAGEPNIARMGVLAPVLDALDVHWIPSFAPEVRAVPDGELPHVPSLRGALSWPNF